MLLLCVQLGVPPYCFIVMCCCADGAGDAAGAGDATADVSGSDVATAVATADVTVLTKVCIASFRELKEYS